MTARSHHVTVRLTDAEVEHLRRWELYESGRGVGAVIRRLIEEEAERERRRGKQLARAAGNGQPG